MLWVAKPMVMFPMLPDFSVTGFKGDQSEQKVIKFTSERSLNLRAPKHGP